MANLSVKTVIRFFVSISIYGIVGFSSNHVFAQNLYSRASNNFNAVNTWWTDAARTVAFVGTPGATHTLNIGLGHTITIPGNTTVTFSGILVADSGAGTLILGNATANASTVTVTNDITVNAAGLLQIGTNTNTTNTLNVTGNIIVSGTLRNGGNGGATNNLSASGSITNNGTLNMAFTADVNTVTFQGAAAQVINGSQTTIDFGDVVINKTAATAVSVGGSITTINARAFTQTLGDFNAPATLSTTGTLTLAAGTFTAGANLNIGGTTTNFTNNGATFVSGSGTVTFTGSGNQVITGTSPTLNYNNLIINKSGGALSVTGSPLNVVNLTRTLGTFTAPATVNVTGNILLTAGTYAAGANTNISGDLTNNGGTFTPGAGNTITFNGAGAQAINGTSSPLSFSNLIINKAGSSTVTAGIAALNVTTLTQTLGNFTAPATLTASATVTLTAGTYTAGANTNIAGDFVITGATFVPGSGTVTFNGAVAQNINSTSATQTFNNVVVNKGGPSTLSTTGSITTLNVAAFTQTLGNFNAPATFYATGALTLAAGTFTAGANTNLDGDFIVNTGSTLAAGTNTVTFGGAGVKTIAGTNATTATFYDLVITSGSVLFGNNATARTINITNNLTVNGGSFSSGASIAGVHTINLTGNLQNDGTIDFSANAATGHIFILLGGSKTISGAGTTTFRNLQKSTTASTNVNVNSSVRVNGALSWSTDGLFILNSSDFTFGNTATVTAPSSVRYIQSDGTSALTGNVVKVNNNTAATWQFLFPIGTATNGYNPVNFVPATIGGVLPDLNSRLAVKAILSPDVPGRLKRTFRLTVTGNSQATTLLNGQFNYNNPGDISGAEPIASYNTFWYQRESTGIWTKPSGTAPGPVGPPNFFTAPTVTAQPLANDTYYFTIGTPGAFGQTWYSYQTGNWDNPLTWTTDGSSFPLYVNPTASIPGFADNVVIKSGNTVTVNINNITINSINVMGTLDMLASTNQTFTTITGSGRIRIAGATDNFPGGVATNFADNAVGGTLEINGTGMLLNTPRTFNNVVINMSATANAAILKSAYTINGDLTITRGLLQFEDVTAPANRTLVVNGHVTVAVSGGIRTHNSNNRHEFNLFGDFVNNGTAYFTNRVAPDYGADATDGIVDVNLLSGSRNQAVTCNGETRFYRIEINKGTDDTYIASITASSAANFNLFGRANIDINGASGANDNALGLVAGTVELGTNVTVLLNNNSNYAIFQAAQLWINGATVTKTGNAIVPYGTVRISAGSLTVLTNGGLTLRDSGIILVEGGVATLGTIRTSTNGANAVGSYIQSGGAVSIVGPEQPSYAMFSLTYPNNVFNMSGGTLTVQNRGALGLRGAIFINSNPANISITGGTVIMEANNANVYRITSRASFWNVIMRATGGTRAVQLLGTTSGTGTVGVDELTLAIQPLVVLNDFTVEGNVTFTTNSADVTVGGNFEIQNGATYTHGTNTTTINGAGVGSLIFGNTTVTQTFNNLTINKTNATDEVAITTGRPSPAAAIQVNGIFSIAKGVFDYGSFIASAKSTVTLASAVTVGKSAGTGRLLLDGAVAQTINSSLASVHNLEVNNTNNVTLATNNFTVLKTLTLTAGNFNIGTFKLTLNGAAAAIAGSGFSATKMIQTSANSSDGGLELYLDANETLTYPIGVSGKYTPVTATFTSFADDGLVTIRPVNGILQTTNLSGGADILAYYWRVGSTGFTTNPTVSYTFQYVAGDVGGIESNYFPGKVLDNSPFTRSSETPSTKVNTTTKVITFNGAGSGFALEAANYTAGGSGRFTGTPTVYFCTVGSGNWNSAATWSLTRGGAGGAGIPGVGDVVIMRRGGSGGYPRGVVTVPAGYTANAAQVVFDDEQGFVSGCPRIIFQTGTPFNSNLGSVIVASSHQGGTLNGDLHGAVIQYNVDNTYSGTFPAGDFGGFNNYLNALVIYEWQSGTGTITLSSSALEYPQLWFQNGSASRIIKFPNVSVNVKGRAYITGANQVMANDGSNSVVLNFQRNLEIGSGCCGGGTFLFPGAAAAAQTVQVDGNIVSTTGGGRNIQILNPATGTLTHKLIVKGDIGIVAGAVMNLGSGSSSETNVNLELQGNTNNSFTNAGTVTLSRIVMNKGNSIANSFTFNDTFTLTGTTNGVSKAIELQNGLLVLNRTSGSPITLTSGGGNFNIPGSAGLEVRSGTVQTSTTSIDANITLDGLLRISGTGIVNVNGGGATDTNYIQYSNSGNAAIEVTGGSLTVAGQIRRDLLSATGVLKYTQSAGTVLVGNESADTNLRGVFEVLNPGSQFSHSGGSFTIVRGNGSASVPSFWLEPGSSSITAGSTITIGNATTPAGTIGIQSTATLNNLTIAGLAASTPQVSMYVTPLTVNGIVSVATGNTLNALGRDLTIGGNFTVNGTYTSGANTTSFNNAATATIGGAVSALSFNNFTKTGAGQLDLARDITVNRDLKASAGTLNTATFAISLLRHAEVDATVISTSGNGLVFGSTLQQQRLTRSVSGTGTLGIVTINNANGVIVPDGNGYDFNITTNLRLQSGVFDIGGSLLSLGVSALITPVNAFSAANLIQTNSSFTDKGVRKQFPLNNNTTDFVFPVGQSNYTPVTFNFSSGGNTTGSSGAPTITVRPSNRIHPVIINGAPAPLNDTQNVLQYYWIINAANVSNTFRSNMSLQYVQPLVAIEPAYNEEDDYIAARILTDLTINPSLNIQKFSAAEVNAATNVITFAFNPVVDQRSITGEYFAGVSDAIPNTVPTYTTTGSGNVGDPIYTPTVFGGVPTGARVIVSAGHNVTFNTGSVILFQTVINATGKITIPSGSIGHSLGTLSGTGDLEINSDGVSAVLPAAEYDTFFSCAGGGLIFGGSGDYEILGGITALRNLTLNGSGDKSLANNNLTICNDLTINSGGFFNSSNRTIIVQNDVLLNGGSFNNSAGTLTITRDFIQTSGTFDGGTSGTKTISRNLVVNGGTFNPGSGSSNIIRINGNMTVAGVATINSGAADVNGQRFTFGGSAAQLLTGDFTGSRAFNRLEINNSAGLTFAGDVTVNRQLLLTNGLITPGTNKFLLAGPAIVGPPAAGTPASFVNGKLFKDIIAAPSIFVFPIGRGTRWRSGYLLVFNTGVWDMEYFDVSAIGAAAAASGPPRTNPVSNLLSSDPSVLRIATGEYWKASDGSATNSGKTARVGLSWGIESNVSANTAEREAMKVMTWNGVNWTNDGGAGFTFPGGGPHTQARGTFQSVNSLSFSENIVTLGSTEVANPLPVTLVKFEGKLDGSIASLNWKTASEINNDYFEVQRSADGLEFIEIGKVVGNGTTNLASEYFFEDRSLMKGNNYYRLKQFDFDGKSSYSNVIVLDYDGSTPLNVFLYPNPTNTQNINLELINPSTEYLNIRILDMTGRVSLQTTISAEELESNISLKPEELKAGVYVVEVIQGTQRVTKRLVIHN
jgi:Secretion system C-terminal sorting domain